MKATKNNQDKQRKGLNQNHRKDNSFAGEYLFIAKVGDKLKDIIRCRLYAAKVRWYCCIWIQTETDYVSGSGYAGGYGYHKPSAAVANAIQAAGFVLSKDISGVGDSAIEEAIQAIAELHGYTGQLFYAHG